ncbi:MAG TPA: hypothetical protein VMV50_00010 [Candidatus Paceibacterota bacterium]|nr:hypothetical protein [Candidatus Paceibacterota bacterium]
MLSVIGWIVFTIVAATSLVLTLFVISLKLGEYFDSPLIFVGAFAESISAALVLIVHHYRKIKPLAPPGEPH